MKTICWDVDDVLFETMKCWLNKNILIHIKYDDLKENPPNNIIGGTLEEYLISLDTFKLNFISDCNVEIFNWLCVYGNKFNHIALTSTSLLTSSRSAHSVIKYYGYWIRSFHVIPSFRKNYIWKKQPKIYDESKAEYIKRIGGVDIFIDDNEKNCKEVAELGIKTFCLDQPWNSSKISTGKILEELTKLGV